MSTIVELIPRTMEATVELDRRDGRPQIEEVWRPGLADEAIRSLVERLFFRRKQASTRHVAFASAEKAADTAHLCSAAAHVLVRQITGDVALVDASFEGKPLPDRLDLPATTREAECQISDRLWIVNRSAWLEAEDERAVTARSISRLRQITSQFDFSILSCDALSTVSSRMAAASDGLVLVLAANRTRRIVAMQMKEHLRTADVPLLGTVLTGRTFPIPEPIYRVL